MTTAAKRSSNKTKSLKAYGRSLSDFLPLLPAERKLIEACRTGEIAVIGMGGHPVKMTKNNKVRPPVIRFLALGGDDLAPVHEQGIQIEGAWVDGDLDLAACHCRAPLFIHSCKIAGDVNVIDATLSMLSLHGTEIVGLLGDSFNSAGEVRLRNGFRATKEVRLLGAKIGGALDCHAGKFEPN
jgi:hypothetical protein